MKMSAQTWQKTLNLEHEPDTKLLDLLETLKDDAPSIKTSTRTPNLLKGPFSSTDIKLQLEEAILTRETPRLKLKRPSKF